MNKKFEIEGHTLEFRSSGSGSIDPWTIDYADEHKIGLMGTCDIRDYLLVDGDLIYEVRNCRAPSFYESNIDNWKDASEWIENNTRKSIQTLTESIDSIKKYAKE